MTKILIATIALQAIFLSTSFAQGTVEKPSGVESQPTAANSVKPLPNAGVDSTAALRSTLTMDKDRGARKNAAVSLGNLKAKDAKTVKALIRHLNDADPAVSKASYAALRKLGRPIVPQLTAAMKLKRPLVRRDAAKLLSLLQLETLHFLSKFSHARAGTIAISVIRQQAAIALRPSLVR